MYTFLIFIFSMVCHWDKIFLAKEGKESVNYETDKRLANQRIANQRAAK